MSKITKPDLSIQWAQTGTVSTPTDGKKQQGWTAEKPAFEYMNWLQNRQDTGIYYTFQMGVPEWDGNTEYQYASGYASYVQYNGVVYKSIQTGTNKNPSTETAYWERAFDSYGSAATVNTALSNHITNYGTLAGLSSASSARTNLSVYSKAETDAAYAPVAGNSAQTFLVGSASSANHAVRKSQFDAKTGQATETTAGIAEIATQAETNAETSDLAVVTPLKLGTYIAQRAASETKSGVAEISTQLEVDTGTDDERIVTPKKLRWGVSVSTGTNGHISLPSWLGGVVINWGTAASVGVEGTSSQTFSMTFPTAVGAIIATPKGAEGGGVSAATITTSNTAGFTLANDTSGGGSTRSFFWLAIGY